MRKPVLLLIVIAAIACSKNNSGKSDELTGSTWRLEAILSDPGNGSGQWTDYKGSPLFLKFEENGTVQASMGLLPSYLDRYSIRDNEVILFINSSTGDSSEFHYEFSPGLNLTLWGPCIEACGKRLIRIGAL